ncbi:MAG: hypothetical protein E6I92_05485 [Chloroflexi bacterium]|nr:MAG: hypothetical protein E6I92_05485 [Chloroflexota bacterium]
MSTPCAWRPRTGGRRQPPHEENPGLDHPRRRRRAHRRRGVPRAAQQRLARAQHQQRRGQRRLGRAVVRPGDGASDKPDHRRLHDPGLVVGHVRLLADESIHRRGGDADPRLGPRPGWHPHLRVGAGRPSARPGLRGDPVRR